VYRHFQRRRSRWRHGAFHRLAEWGIDARINLDRYPLSGTSEQVRWLRGAFAAAGRIVRSPLASSSGWWGSSAQAVLAGLGGRVAVGERSPAEIAKGDGIHMVWVPTVHRQVKQSRVPGG
jgi:hypothetical protein